MGIIEEAISKGARQASACNAAGLSVPTFRHWKKQDGGEDRRYGPKSVPKNKIGKKDRQKLLKIANSPEFRDKSPNQFVPELLDRDEYYASESTFYRALREAGQLKHRGNSKAPQKRHRPRALTAKRPNQVWCWDITFLRAPVKGTFYFLYMVIDVWSRKIVSFEVNEVESAEYAAILFEDACENENIEKEQLVVHSDNGTPMKGAVLQATLNRMGVDLSYSRPSVSNDNPYAESLFRTLKYRPEFPKKPFSSIEEARLWVEVFVVWYNSEHLHSKIKFVTPADRHAGRDKAILKNRDKVHKKARRKHPERWSGKTRNWNWIEEVTLNPEPKPPTTKMVVN